MAQDHDKKPRTGRRWKLSLLLILIAVGYGVAVALIFHHYTVLILALTALPLIMIYNEASIQAVTRLTRDIRKTEKRVERTKAQLTRFERQFNQELGRSEDQIPALVSGGAGHAGSEDKPSLDVVHVAEFLRGGALHHGEDSAQILKDKTLSHLIDFLSPDAIYARQSLLDTPSTLDASEFDSVKELNSTLKNSSGTGLVIDRESNFNSDYYDLRELALDGRIVVALVQDGASEELEEDEGISHFVGLVDMPVLPLQVGVRTLYPSARLEAEPED
ncbi:hypothetical protein GC425_08590 [Corynebacterium sp. zg254]|uniref:Uncharacterized protein n=1 Tax=Corynebacterium zhongnanshanii TaxID=2768834 RepID=A0ABQ6VCL0_9CORY|nr:MULTISPECIES: hypothetical protein [Corynebacterium]KAB3519959.1 hypothetical protein F8377_08630 [Corynebacterium zhongnanshanii]MCR5914908.1 hypothetical protein [Corynebacterium sp. zg254]